MAQDANQYLYNHKDVVENLIKRQGIHEGRWILTLELGLKAANIDLSKGNEATVLTPGALVGVLRIGITRTNQKNELTVDAAEVNPLKSSIKATKSRKRFTK